MTGEVQMSPDRFFTLFMDELRTHPEMQSYYKFLGDPSRLHFRRNYFISRLEFILRNAGATNNFIWDAGCGYGTSALFLALNGYRVHGSTLEFYFKEIPQRASYWSQFGPADNFTYAYEDIYTAPALPESPARIVVQDTLHHLEPIDAA